MSELIPGITIFTPTYNRVDTLRRLYESIANQKYDNIEWIIVDDGSTDGTEDLVASLIKEGTVEIRYFYKSNGGKHTALNLGIHEASKEYFFCVDSDDYLENGAISIIQDTIIRERPEGIIAYKSEHPYHKRIGSMFPEHLEYVTLINLINDYKCSGDRAIIHKTSAIKDCLIPEVVGQRFFPETYLFDRFDEKHKSYLLRENLCVCEYMPEGYSSSFRQLMIDNALAMKMFFSRRIDMNVSWGIRYDAAYRYVAFSLLSGSNQGNYTGNNTGLLLLALIPGIIMYFVYSYHKAVSHRKKK